MNAAAAFGDPRLPVRFWEKVAVQASGCWLWTASRTTTGYGQTSFGKRHFPAHLVSFRTFVGPTAPGYDVDHRCHTAGCSGPAKCIHRLCVNPAHLQLLTRRENLLRGRTLPARQVTLTACPKGHPYSPENTYHPNPGRSVAGRACRICHRDRKRDRREYLRQVRSGTPTSTR